MRERSVARGIDVNLGAVQADRAKLQQAHLLRQFQHLHKNARQLVQKAPPECGQGVVIRVAARGNEPERHRIKGRPLNLAAGKHPGCIAINQQRQQLRRMVGCAASALVGLLQPAQVQPIHHLNNKPCQVILR